VLYGWLAAVSRVATRSARYRSGDRAEAYGGQSIEMCVNAIRTPGSRRAQCGSSERLESGHRDERHSARHRTALSHLVVRARFCRLRIRRASICDSIKRNRRRLGAARRGAAQSYMASRLGIRLTAVAVRCRLPPSADAKIRLCAWHCEEETRRILKLGRKRAADLTRTDVRRKRPVRV